MPRHKLDLSSGVKTCPRCGLTKSLSEFHKSKDTLHGYQVYCKPCGNERHAEWVKTRPDIKAYRAERSREWREKNKEKYQDYQLTRTYGLPAGGYKKLLEAQNGKCAICKSPDPGGKGKFHVDHCHDTNRIRGLLCHGCNVGIGSLKHDSLILRSAIEYLSRT